MFDLIRLRTFRAMLAEGSVNGAAANLGYTPSAVSQQIHGLQRETGLELFERNGRGIVATPVGRQFAREAEQLLEQAAKLEALAADLRDGRTGALTLRHFSSVGVALLPPVVATFSREFPDLRLDLRLWELAQSHGDDPDVEICVDVAASGQPDTRGRDGYDVEALLTEPYVAVVPMDHRLARRTTVPLSELIPEKWVDNDVAEGPCRQILLEACAAAGFTPSFHLDTQDEGAAVAFVEAGAGITVMPELTFSTTRADMDKVAVVNLADPAPTRTIMVRSRKSLRRNSAARRLVELLREQVARQATP